MSYTKEKMIQEAGTPALLCFKPEELPTSCRIASVITDYSSYSCYINISNYHVDIKIKLGNFGIGLTVSNAILEYTKCG